MEIIEIKNLRYERPENPYDVIVDRRHPLGNPFHMNNESERDRVCNEYDNWLQIHVTNGNMIIIHELEKLVNRYTKFNRLRLFCWCYPKRCHAESIRKQLLKVFPDDMNVTFVESYLKGIAKVTEIDDYVDYWHEYPNKEKLHDFLGLTWEEYGDWATSPSSLSTILSTKNKKLRN